MRNKEKSKDIFKEEINEEIRKPSEIKEQRSISNICRYPDSRFFTKDKHSALMATCFTIAQQNRLIINEANSKSLL